MTENIARAFRARYLDTHEKYLDSIVTLLRSCNGGYTPSSPVQFMLRQVVSVKSVSSQMRARNSFDKARALRNLRNSWYHECALNYPDDLNDRMKFAPWKIIQFFYAIYSALSAVVRCFDDHPRLRQQTALNEFTTEVIINPPTSFMPVPFNFYLRGGVITPSPPSVISWPYGLSWHVPNVQRCLESLHATSTSPVSLFHYFKSLREWANYEDSYIFINLFGPSIISGLDSSLSRIVPWFCPVAEVFLISFCGWNIVQEQFKQFASHIEQHLEVRPSPLISRFEEYSKCPHLLTWILRTISYSFNTYPESCLTLVHNV